MPAENYPFPWSVNHYIERETVTKNNVSHMENFAGDVSKFLQELQRISTKGAPVAGAHNFFRGASPAVYQRQVDDALDKPEKDWPMQTIKTI